MDSNITLRSNVYINQSAQRDDKRFLQHITDYRVLKRYKGSSYGFQNNISWMTPVQLEILRQGQPNCSLEKGTMSWGVPVGGERMVCRCEQYDCPRFSICSKYSNFSLVSREIEKETAPQPEQVTPLGLYTEQPEVIPEVDESPEFEEQNESTKIEEKNGDSASIEPIHAEPAPEVDEEATTEHTETREIKSQVQPTERQVVSQEIIINANIHDRIWVNAGPGTGKTYTVIQRLKKLLNDGIEGSILVLCFSRNAVQVIRERLTEELGYIASTLIDDGQLVIRTFDSFATYMLEDELNPAWDYNQRIEAFIKMIDNNSGALNEMLGYLIVDEIQDTVGVRARMLLSILDELNCGALLLGDSCQAIFDWTIRDSDDMTFDALTSELEKRQFIKYELCDNRRQTAELAEVGLQLRDKILHASEEDQEEAINHFKQWAGSKWSTFSIKVLPKQLNGSTDLILCKTNGEAAHISQILFESSTSIEHMMKQSSSHRSLAAWIAKLLKGNDGSYLSREAFISNAEQNEINDVDEKWNALKSLDEHPHAAVLHIKEVLAALSKMDSLPNVCLNQHDNCAIVSTVHRAKGNTKKKVSFQYFSYNVRKEQKLKYDGYTYVFSPYKLIWNGDYYYVVGYSEKHKGIGSFRIDRVARCPKILDEDAVRPPKGFDLNVYLNSMFRMYNGERKQIELVCDNDLMDAIIDKFGKDVIVLANDMKSFRAVVTTGTGPVFFSWVFGFGSHVSIKAPEDVKGEYARLVLEAAEAIKKTQ